MQNRKPRNKTRQPMKSRQNIRLIIAFDGTAYHGWQIQRNAATVQGLLSEAITRITGARPVVTGSGRTDAGTHARGLAANFMTSLRLPPARWVRALNGILPRDIRVLSARRVSCGFHARRDAISKVYRYQIYLGPVLPPHLRREYFHFPYPVDIRKMEAAAGLFAGEHDFTSFAKTNASRSSAVRRIFSCELKKRGHRLFLTVEGDGFLHHMVRNMAGTLLEVGAGAIGLSDLRKLFAERDRELAGFTAPANGLVLVKVRY